MRSRTMMGMLMFTVFVSTGWPAEFPLKLKKLDLDEATALNLLGGAARLRTDRPTTITKESKPLSSRPLYGVLRFGDEGGRAFRLDESREGKGYDRLVVDLNADGDLSDDAEFKALERKQESDYGSERRVFGPIELPASKGGVWVPSYYVDVFAYPAAARSSRGGYAGTLRLLPACRLETTVELGGVKQKIGFVDGNFNLRPGDKSEVQPIRIPGGPEYWTPPQGVDQILRDYDGSGSFRPRGFESEADPVSSVVFFGANPFMMELPKDFTTVRFEPYAGPTGELTAKNAASLETVGLFWESSPGKWEYVAPGLKSGKAKVPAGSYTFYTCVLAVKDRKGTKVSSLGMNSDAKGRRINVEAGQTAELRCGLPIEVKVEADRSVSSGFLAALFSSGAGDLNISASMTGAGGETYSAFQAETGGDAASPKFTITGADGKQLASGDMSFG